MFGFLKSATDKITEAREVKIEDLNFETREEYREWRREWFAAYRAAIQGVRDAKAAKKQVQRDGAGVHANGSYEAWARHSRAWSDACSVQHRATARVDSLVSTRWASRTRAGELRAKRLEKAVA